MTEAPKPTIAVLDDEASMVEIVSMVLRRAGYDVRSFTDPDALLGSLQRAPVDLLLTDLKMPSKDGVAVLTLAREALPGLPVILFTAHATVQTAIEAMRRGAYDYIQKPFDNAELRSLVARALDHSWLARENRYLRGEGGPMMIAESPGMRAVLGLVRRIAPSRSTVLITGESGVGKEVVARALHGYGERADGPFVALNCKALSDSLLESELFGHEAGSFTGARERRAGVFERADGGTLFLDEIGEVSGAFQAKLLRVLQEREVSPVGASAPVRVDVRVLAATNRDLDVEVREGRFREDLFFRLNVIPLEIPPLRDRVDDILPLARHVLARVEREAGRAPRGWTPEAEGWLLSHRWPGNVRELSNVIERGAVLCRGEWIERADLTLEASEGGPDEAPPTTLADFLDRAAQDHIRRVLDDVSGKRVEAARRLGIDRTTLYRLMRKYGVE